MSQFIQFHTLTALGPSNPNRDDAGRPKMAMVGGENRLRLSSQSRKRALRECSFFSLDLAGNMGTRTKGFYNVVEQHLIEGGTDAAKASAIAEAVASVFGPVKRDDKGATGTTLAFISSQEKALALELADKTAAGEKLPKDKELKKLVLQRADGAVDIAMFGRMLAGDPEFNREAAVQVSHAFTTHRASAQRDWFSAVDDLNSEDGSAAHIGETEFGSGVFYGYVCVNVSLLMENLGGDIVLTSKALHALTRGLIEAVPRGKQNSFANHPRPDFILMERGTQAPRDLSGAFFDVVRDTPLLAGSIDRLQMKRADLDKAYGPFCDAAAVLHVGVEGSLQELLDFADGSLKGAV